MGFVKPVHAHKSGQDEDSACFDSRRIWKGQNVGAQAATFKLPVVVPSMHLWNGEKL